jgi:hypothetical protein
MDYNTKITIALFDILIFRSPVLGVSQFQITRRAGVFPEAWEFYGGAFRQLDDGVGVVLLPVDGRGRTQP